MGKPDYIAKALGDPVAMKFSKRRVLITGADGSRGSVLMSQAPFYGWEPVGLTMKEMEMPAWLLPEQPCDAIVNCHGLNYLMSIENFSMPRAMKLFQVNIAAPLAIISGALRVGWPEVRVLNIASQTYRVPQRNTAAYCASKAALVQATRVAARELAPRGWVVNALAPGKIADTHMSELTDAQVRDLRGWSQEEADKYALSLIPAGRFTTRVEVADAVFKILALPRYINGAVIDMTGGV